ncbi:MAG TPA: energy transducer TonB [Bacteroidetes bacterium]|nr:energy transducer TonB [Bacteroidota bacterium]
MKTLTDIKNELKAILPQGIDLVLQAIKAAISEGTDKYNDLLLIEGRYQDVSKRLLQGVIGNEAALLEFNNVRKNILDFIDGLEDNHLAKAEGMGADGKPDIYNGEVMYRIPKEMLLQQDTKCVVRLAFERKLLLEDFDEAKGDVLKDIRISEVMGVELLDPADKTFEIRTLHDTVQFVEKGLFTEWVFYVKPIVGGTHSLVLKISIIEIKDGIERKRNVVLEEKVVIVATAPAEFGGEKGFVKAGISLAVAQQQNGTGGTVSKMVEQPSPAPMDPPPPAPPAPKSGGVSFRKIASSLSALLVLVVASWAVLSRMSDGGRPGQPKIINPGESKTVAMSEEKKAWKKIEKAPTKEALEAFEDRFPGGEFANVVRIKLDSLDNSLWQSAIAANDAVAIENYYNKYPAGLHAVEANIMLEELKNPRMEAMDDQNIIKPIREKTHTGGAGTPKVIDKTKQKKTKGLDAYTPSFDPNKPVPMRQAFRLPVFPKCENDDYKKERSCTDKRINRYIKQNLKYPAEALRKKLEGTVTVEFVIEKNGSISGVQYKNDIGGGCAAEAVRLVRKLPKFKPGVNRKGEVVRVDYVLPIKFKING